MKLNLALPAWLQYREEERWMNIYVAVVLSGVVFLGFMLNALKLFSAPEFQALEVIRLIGVVVWPLGCVLGYV